MDKLREALRPNDKAVASADRRERRGSARLSVSIEKVPLFKGVSSAVLEDIGKALLPVRLQAGDYAVREGDVAKEMLFVISGTIEVVGKDGQVFATGERIISFLFVNFRLCCCYVAIVFSSSLFFFF